MQGKIIVAGVDVGAATAKTVILTDGQFFYSIMPTGYSVPKAAEAVTKEALDKAGLSMADLRYVIGTGYGRNNIRFANKAVTEIICHGKGAYYFRPAVRTIVDIGGQDSKVIGLDDKGRVNNFVMNDKCAAGTGRFLDVMAEVLQAGSIENMGPISLTSKDPCQVSSTCTIFAESEVVSLRAEGRSREDLIAGVHKAVVSRVAVMGRTVGFRKEVMFTGGVAKNVGVKKFLEDELGMEVIVTEECQVMGAMGAALLAKEIVAGSGG